MTAEFDSGPQPPPLEPRLAANNLKPPFRPNAYFWVGFFAGFVPMGYLAITNARRLSRDNSLTTKTSVAAGAVALIAFVGLSLIHI